MSFGSINNSPAELAVFVILIHCLDAKMIIALFATGVGRFDSQLVGSIDELGQTFLQRITISNTHIH